MRAKVEHAVGKGENVGTPRRRARVEAARHYQHDVMCQADVAGFSRAGRQREQPASYQPLLVA